MCLALMELCSSRFGAGVLYRMETTASCFTSLSWHRFADELLCLAIVTCMLLQANFRS